MHRLRICSLILGLLAGTQFAFSQQQGTLNLTVQRDGQPVPGARIALLIGRDATNLPLTGPKGDSTALVSVDKIVNEYAEVWVEQCPNQPYQVFLAVNRVRAPEQSDPACTRHNAGFFIARGDGPWHITVDTSLLTVTTAGPLPQLTPGPSDEEVSGESKLWAQASFGAGVNFTPGVSDSCSTVLALEPGATCAATLRTLDLLANASVNWSIVGGEGGFWRASATDLTADAVLNGTPSRLVSSYEPLGVYGAAVVHLPVGGRFSVVPKAGGTYWRVSLTQHQTVGSGTPSSTKSTLTGFSPFLGASVDAMLFRNIGVGADYAFVRLRHEPVLAQDNHLVFFHVLLRFGSR